MKFSWNLMPLFGFEVDLLCVCVNCFVSLLKEEDKGKKRKCEY